MEKAISRSLFVLLMFVVLSGCGTTFHVVPEIGDIGSTDFGMIGRVNYSGNPDYLPRTVKPSDEESGNLEFKYDYNVGYGQDAVPDVLPLFNPLSLVGFPIGSDSLVVVGKLDLLKDGEVVKTYCSTCVIDKTRNLFYEGKTHSELRRQGLLRVRDNIEIQMANGHETLLELVQ